MCDCAAAVSDSEVNETTRVRTRGYDVLTEGERHETVGMTEVGGKDPSLRALTKWGHVLSEMGVR